MKHLFKAVSIGLILFSSTLFAQHGKDFLVASSCTTPHKGLVCAHLSTKYYRADDHEAQHYEISPGIIYGITNDWTTEFHSHLRNTDGVTNLEALAIETRYRFFSEHSEGHPHEEKGYPFSFAGLFEYEKRFHGMEDSFEGRLMIGKELGPIELVGNLIAAKSLDHAHHEFELRYAFGLRTSVMQSLGATFELVNGDSHLEGTQLTTGINIDITKRIDFKIGTSFNIMHGGTKLSAVQSMLMYTF